MTREEIRKAKRNKFLKGLLFILCFLISFLCGSVVNYHVCKFNKGYVHKVEHSGTVSVHINVVHTIEQNQEVSEETNIVDEEFIPEDVTESATEVEEGEFISFYTYTEEELDLLSRLIYSEGGTESYDTKLKIGSVVMNRVEAKDFPDTIREVIYQEGQFAVTTHKINGIIMIEQPADEDSKRAAKEVLDYGSVLPPDVQVFYANHIRNEGNWVTTRKIYEICDSTVFAYIYEE